jgi:hypothetical protein
MMKTETLHPYAGRRDRLMQTLLLLLCLLSAKAEAQPLNLSPLVELTEVKNVGLSASNQSKSVIQALWSVNAQTGTNIKSFELNLEVIYADGAVEKFRSTAQGSERRTRFEVPTLHLSPGRPGAELKSFKTSITANFSETASKQGNF